MDNELGTEHEDLEQAIYETKQGYKEALDDTQIKADTAAAQFQLAQRIVDEFLDRSNPPSEERSKPDKVAQALIEAAPYVGLLLAENGLSSKAHIVADMLHVFSYDTPTLLTSPPTYTTNTIELEIRRLQRCDRSSRDQLVSIDHFH